VDEALETALNLDLIAIQAGFVAVRRLKCDGVAVAAIAFQRRFGVDKTTTMSPLSAVDVSRITNYHRRDARVDHRIALNFRA
jgi:hypothetical protein